MNRLCPLLIIGVSVISFVPRSVAQAVPDSAFIRDNYIKFEYRIPMRDGVRLFTSVYIPKDTTAAHPITPAEIRMNTDCASAVRSSAEVWPKA